MRKDNYRDIRSFLGNSFLNTLPDNYHEFYARIAYIIARYLSSQSNKKILFIQVPVEEYSDDEVFFKEDWQNTCNVIAHILRLTLSCEMYNPWAISYPGNWYKENDKFFLVAHPSHEEPYYFLECKNNKLRFYPKKVLGKNDPAIKPPRKQEIIQRADGLYKISNIPIQRNNGFIKCQEEIKFIDVSYYVTSIYKSASIICSNPPSCPAAGKYLLPTVDINNSNCEIPNSDVIVIIGDGAYNQIQQAINKLEPFGKIKKLIVIGTAPTAELLEENPEIVSISFRKVHQYFADYNLIYQEPQFIDIDFPWIISALSNLKDIIESNIDELGYEGARHIFNFSRKIFADIDFSKEVLKRFKDRFVQLLENEYDDFLPEEIENQLTNWVENLSYEEESNPKKQYVDSLKNEVVIIRPDRSIKRQLKDDINSNKIIIVDAPIHRPPRKKDKYVQSTLTLVKRYNNVGEIRCLYYRGIETELKLFSQKNIEQDHLHNPDNVGVKQQENNHPTPNVGIEEFSLDNYTVQLSDWTRFDPRINIPKVKFIDDSQEIISGDVIIVGMHNRLTRENFSDIENPEGLTIKYYSANNNSDIFEKLTSAFFHFPDGKNVSYYSSLWQSALKRLDDSFDKETRKKFLKETGISNAVLRNHLNGVSSFMKKRTMSLVLRKLLAEHLLTETDVQYVIKANRFVKGNHIKFGYKLKNALFNYLLKPNKPIDNQVSILLRKTNLSIEDVVSELIITNTIKKIIAPK